MPQDSLPRASRPPHHHTRPLRLDRPIPPVAAVWGHDAAWRSTNPFRLCEPTGTTDQRRLAVSRTPPTSTLYEAATMAAFLAWPPRSAFARRPPPPLASPKSTPAPTIGERIASHHPRFALRIHQVSFPLPPNCQPQSSWADARWIIHNTPQARNRQPPPSPPPCIRQPAPSSLQALVPYTQRRTWFASAEVDQLWALPVRPSRTPLRPSVPTHPPASTRLLPRGHQSP